MFLTVAELKSDFKKIEKQVDEINSSLQDIALNAHKMELFYSLNKEFKNISDELDKLGTSYDEVHKIFDNIDLSYQNIKSKYKKYYKKINDINLLYKNKISRDDQKIYDNINQNIRDIIKNNFKEDKDNNINMPDLQSLINVYESFINQKDVIESYATTTSKPLTNTLVEKIKTKINVDSIKNEPKGIDKEYFTQEFKPLQDKTSKIMENVRDIDTVLIEMKEFVESI